MQLWKSGTNCLDYHDIIKHNGHYESLEQCGSHPNRGGLVEGNSIRSTCRMTGVAKGTVLKLLAELGEACAAYHDEHVRNVSTRRIQCDEIWSFCMPRTRTYRPKRRRMASAVFGLGRSGCRYEVDGVVHVWRAGALTAILFIKDLASRLSNRVQLTTDGHRAYLDAVEEVFGTDVDYAMLIKMYGHSSESRRYSPGEMIGTETIVRPVGPIPSTSARHTLSARTSPCVCRCADSPA